MESHGSTVGTTIATVSLTAAPIFRAKALRGFAQRRRTKKSETLDARSI